MLMIIHYSFSFSPFSFLFFFFLSFFLLTVAAVLKMKDLGKKFETLEKGCLVWRRRATPALRLATAPAWGGARH